MGAANNINLKHNSIRFRSKEEYEGLLNEHIGFEERTYLELYF